MPYKIWIWVSRDGVPCVGVNKERLTVFRISLPVKWWIKRRATQPSFII